MISCKREQGFTGPWWNKNKLILFFFFIYSFQDWSWSWLDSLKTHEWTYEQNKVEMYEKYNPCFVPETRYFMKDDGIWRKCQIFFLTKIPIFRSELILLINFMVDDVFTILRFTLTQLAVLLDGVGLLAAFETGPKWRLQVSLPFFLATKSCESWNQRSDILHHVIGLRKLPSYHSGEFCCSVRIWVACDGR